MPEAPYQPTAAITPSAATIAEWLGGRLLDGERAPAALHGLATLAEAGPGQISFIASDRAAKEAAASAAGLLLTSPRWDVPGRARIVVDEVWAAVAELMRRLYPTPAPPPGVHPTAVLGRDVRVGEGASIGPYCVVGDGCVIGDGAVLGPHCVLDAGCSVGDATRLVARVTLMGPVRLGRRVLIHPGAVLGADGFKFEPVRGLPHKIPQVGTVIVEDDVEIGANTTIDRAFLYETRIGHHVKLDNLVQIGHNVRIGPATIMAAQTGIAGSTQVGAGCLMGGQVGLRDGITVGDGVMIGAQSGINASLAAGEKVQGTPSMELKLWWRVSAALTRLPDYARRLRAIERRLGLVADEKE